MPHKNLITSVKAALAALGITSNFLPPPPALPTRSSPDAIVLSRSQWRMLVARLNWQATVLQALWAVEAPQVAALEAIMTQDDRITQEVAQEAGDIAALQQSLKPLQDAVAANATAISDLRSQLGPHPSQAVEDAIAALEQNHAQFQNMVSAIQSATGGITSADTAPTPPATP